MFMTTRANGMLAIVIASFLWGTTGTAANFAPDISSFAIGAFSMGFGGILLCVNARERLAQDLSCIRKTPLSLMLGSLCVVLYPLAFYTSMRWSGVAIGTVVSIASAPLFAAIIERLFCKKTFSLKWLLSFVFGASGIVLLSIGRAEIDALEADEITQQLGIFLGLIAGLTYAGYSFAVKNMISKGMNSRSAMASLFGIAAIILLPSLFITGKNLFTTVENSMVAIYMAVVPMFLGYLLYGFGLRTIDASTATIITLIEPLIASILAVWIIGEEFKPIGWMGMGLVCVCLLIQSVNVKLKNQNTHLRKVS